MFNLIMKKFVGSANERAIKLIQPVVEQVNAFEESTKALSDDALKAKTEEFRKSLESGKLLDDILPEAFAVMREAALRVTGMRHYDVQIVGGVVLHQGKIAEMGTGEGKTLVATLPVYLNALTKKGVFIVTVNDYLAKRDKEWMGPIYEFLGLTVGVIQQNQPPAERQEAYGSDITFGTNNEYGFDFLRDNMVVDRELKVQRNLHFAIVDEVDSILVDEARTPLIISGPAEESTDKYYKVNRIIPQLDTEADYESDEKAHTVNLTEKGIRHCEKLLGVENLYDNMHIDLVHHINQAVRAHVLYKRDVDYMVKDGKVEIVDEFTGRLMPGRRFSDGLHQALEAKEGVNIERENQTLGSVTFQNYFRMFDKLGGMTGTALTEAVEFEKIYKLEVLAIPPNKVCQREDIPDGIYKNAHGKYSAVVRTVKEMHTQGRPVLVGTISIEKSEYLSNALRKENLNHTVLNAKFHEKEAEIISRAGQEGAITIATNMAGRGTDIVLGEGVADKGGLHVIGTERHESRRIDNQLRGRCGRQGDPGSTQFFISLEDDLMRVFGGEKIMTMMDSLGLEDDEEISHGLVSKAIEKAQKRVESRNFDIRKHLLEYDDVMNRQREIIYDERRLILQSDDLDEHVMDMAEELIAEAEGMYLQGEGDEGDEDNETTFFKSLSQKFGVDLIPLNESLKDTREFAKEVLTHIEQVYQKRKDTFTSETMLHLERSILLQVIDGKWKDHLRSLDDLREGIGLRAYGQRDPLMEYKKEAFQMFDAMTSSIKQEAVEFIFRVDVVKAEEMRAVFSGDQTLVHEEQEVFGGGVTPAEEKRLSEAAHPASEPTGQPVDTGVPAAPIKRTEEKVGRNDPCPCGSGKKYKKCHGS